MQSKSKPFASSQIDFSQGSHPFIVISKFEHTHNTRECLAYISSRICKGLGTRLWHPGHGASLAPVSIDVFCSPEEKAQIFRLSK